MISLVLILHNYTLHPDHCQGYPPVQTAQNDMVDSGQDEEYTYEDKPKKSFDGFKF